MSTSREPVNGADRAALEHAMIARLLEEAGLEAGSGQVISHRPDRTAAPMSHSQELLWLLDQSTPGLTAYNGPVARRLTGAVDVAALRRALDATVERHEPLRTRFRSEGDEFIQEVMAATPVALEEVDLRAVPARERERALASGLARAARTPFDLRRDQLLRAWLFRLGEREQVLLLVSHHIVMDGWSLGILLRELSTLYAAFTAGAEPSLAPLPISYGDFAAWQRESTRGPQMAGHLEWWREVLSGLAPDAGLATDRPRPAGASFEGATERLIIPRPTLEALKELGQSQGASLFMVIAAAYLTLLSRETGQADVVIGSPVAGRVARETEGLVGYFNNPLVLRARFDDDPTWIELLSRVREMALGAFERQEVPFELLARDLEKNGRSGDAPLFRHVLTMQDAHATDLNLPGVVSAPQVVEHGSVKFDLTLLTSEHGDGLHFDLEYRTQLFERETIRRFLARLATLLDGIATAPATRVSALPVLPASEQAQLAGWNATARALGAPTTMAALIAAAAGFRPTAPAVVSGDVTLTWAELMAQASRLAHSLQARGVGPDTVVGLCAERSAELVVGMVGILLAGGAYLPLLPDLPAARLAGLLEASRARLVVTLTAHRALLPASVPVFCLDEESAHLAAHPATPPVSGATPDSLAYLLFTSGSTGVPKGVAVTHGNLVHYTRAIAAVLGLDLTGAQAPWHGATVSTLAADLGHTAVFPMLASGGALHVLCGDVVTDAAQFQQYAAAHPLDLLKITPSHFQALAGPEFRPEHLPRRWLVLGGEPCPWGLVDSVVSREHCRVLNHYGPTETTVGACTFEVTAASAAALAPWAPATVPIGRPLPNMTAHLLDARQRLVPIGVPGELWLGGPGVARGYLGRDDLTSERFGVTAGERRYRTGDRMRRLPTGDLEFLGRLDTQVKVRGHRVELGEIETVLAQHPAVRQAVVMLHDEVLVGYVVHHAAAKASALRAHVAGLLPEYMVPTEWVVLDQLPLTPNGKVDRARLRAPAAVTAAPDDGAPRNETEQRLMTLWAEVLKKESVGRDDNFFALGGHSLLAIRLLGRIAKAFGPKLPLRTLFEHPTIAGLAPALVVAGAAAAPEAGR